MAKYKATNEFKKLDNQFFSDSKIERLLKGESIEITTIGDIPAKVSKCLIEDKPGGKK